MEIKVYRKTQQVKEPIDRDLPDHAKEQGQAEKLSASGNTKEYYAQPRLLRRDGLYYIAYEYEWIPIEEWEAMVVYHQPDMVYDVIVSHKRRFHFNAAEDTIH